VTDAGAVAAYADHGDAPRTEKRFERARSAGHSRRSAAATAPAVAAVSTRKVRTPAEVVRTVRDQERDLGRSRTDRLCAPDREQLVAGEGGQRDPLGAAA
jgi:hypothetical protein